MSSSIFRLQFPIEQIPSLAERFSYNIGEDDVLAQKNQILRRGYLLKGELITICEWKSLRPRKHSPRNEDEYIREVTKLALSTSNERLRIEILTVLDGVKWPTASTILHFYHTEKYPILDKRALESLGCGHIKPKDYSYNFWITYVQFCRGLADQLSIEMRTLDKALWQWSKENKVK